MRRTFPLAFAVVLVAGASAVGCLTLLPSPEPATVDGPDVALFKEFQASSRTLYQVIRLSRPEDASPSPEPSHPDPMAGIYVMEVDFADENIVLTGASNLTRVVLDPGAGIASLHAGRPIQGAIPLEVGTWALEFAAEANAGFAESTLTPRLPPELASDPRGSTWYLLTPPFIWSNAFEIYVRIAETGAATQWRFYAAGADRPLSMLGGVAAVDLSYVERDVALDPARTELAAPPIVPLPRELQRELSRMPEVTRPAPFHVRQQEAGLDWVGGGHWLGEPLPRPGEPPDSLLDPDERPASTVLEATCSQGLKPFEHAWRMRWTSGTALAGHPALRAPACPVLIELPVDVEYQGPVSGCTAIAARVLSPHGMVEDAWEVCGQRLIRSVALSVPSAYLDEAFVVELDVVAELPCSVVSSKSVYHRFAVNPYFGPIAVQRSCDPETR